MLANVILGNNPGNILVEGLELGLVNLAAPLIGQVVVRVMGRCHIGRIYPILDRLIV